MNTHIRVYIEIEKGSDQKYEFNQDTHKLELDRVLTPPHVYPFAYGFIPETRADDGDELDVLVISESDNIEKDTYQNVYIIGALLMADEHGDDEKILTVPESVYESGKICGIHDLPSDILVSIQSFFANYKTGETGKWSQVDGFVNRNYAGMIYEKTRRVYNSSQHDYAELSLP